MKTVFAIIGALTVLFAVLGSIGIGHFAYVYGPNKVTCITVEESKK